MYQYIICIYLSLFLIENGNNAGLNAGFSHYLCNFACQNESHKLMKENCQTRRMYGHNYAIPGTYEVTMVVANRRPVFGEIIGSTKAGGKAPQIKPSVLGEIVLNNEIPKIHMFYPMVEVWQTCLMPDHIHMIIRINQSLPEGKHLGIVIGAFKGGISRAWWQLQEATVSVASASEEHIPLFEPNYNDHILMRDGQLDNWKRYLSDNPRRYIMRHEYPNLFQRAHCITIGGIRYKAFGNMLLLRQPEKHQVFFHRHTDGVLTENTEFWQKERHRLISAAKSGDVLVTPGISECEKRIKNIALEEKLRLIHIQDTAIHQYWKPERSRFEACAAGTLLILAPWPEDIPSFKSNYERFHYLNHLAETICAIGHKTEVVIQGLRLGHGDIS